MTKETNKISNSFDREFEKDKSSNSKLNNKVYLILKDSELNKIDSIDEDNLKGDTTYHHSNTSLSYSDALLSAKEKIDSNNLQSAYIYEASAKFHKGETFYGYDEEEDSIGLVTNLGSYSYKVFNSIKVTKNKNGISITELGETDTLKWVKDDIEDKIDFTRDIRRNREQHHKDSVRREEYDRENIYNEVVYNNFKTHKYFGSGKPSDLEKNIKEISLKYENNSLERLNGFTVFGVDSSKRKEAKANIGSFLEDFKISTERIESLKEDHKKSLDKLEKDEKKYQLLLSNLEKKLFITDDDLKEDSYLKQAEQIEKGIAQTAHEERMGAVATYDEMDRVSEFNENEYSHTEEYVCSFEKIKSGDLEAYNKHANSYTLRSNSLEEVINKGIKLINTENNGNSLYISSTGLSAVSPWDNDNGYRKITEPSQIKLIKSKDNYQITKEYGNIFDDSREAIKQEMKVLKGETEEYLSINGYYDYPPAESAVVEIESILEKNYNSLDKNKNDLIYEIPKKIYEGHNIEESLQPLQLKGVARVFPKVKTNKIIKEINRIITKRKSEEQERNNIFSEIKEKQKQQEKQHKENLRMINRLEKSMKFTLKEGEKLQLSKLPLVIPDKKASIVQDQKKSFKI